MPRPGKDVRLSGVLRAAAPPGPAAARRRPGHARRGRLLAAAAAFVTRLVERYRDRDAIIAWQVEHEAVRAADPGRPVLMNGFLPASAPVTLQQWWRTRDQGDSLSVAGRLADIVGVDFYPRHAVASAGPLTLYLDGSQALGSMASRRPGGSPRILAWPRCMSLS